MTDDEWRRNVMETVETQDGIQLQQLLQYSKQQSLDYSIGRYSPLTRAACLKSCNIIEQLLLAGAHVDFPKDCGQTPLMITASNGNIHMSELLLKYDANVNARNHKKVYLSVLCYAVRVSNARTVALLLEHGALAYDSSKEEVRAAAPMHTAIQYKSPCMLKLLLDHADKINRRIPPAEFVSPIFTWGSEKCAIVFMQEGYYPKPEWFHCVTYYNMPKLMSLLVEINPHYLQRE